MSYNTKKVLAVFLAVLIVFGWYVTIFGIGGFGSIRDHMKLGLDIKGGVYVVMEAKTDLTGNDLKRLMDQTQAVIERRVNEFGLSEPVVTIEGDKRIRVELPGIEDTKQAIDTIGQTAQLQFMLADGTVALDGSMIKDASAVSDSRHGGYAISLEFDREGTVAFAEATRKAYSGRVSSIYDGIPGNSILIVLDGDIISYPTVSNVIENGKAEITSSRMGGYPRDEALTQAALIRGGALPVPLEEITSSTRTATIGVDALEKSIYAGLIGFILVFIVMLLAYRIMGVAANIALALYVIIVLWVIVLMGGVLTLPGIAGIILSIGMALDANVIIFSRIREELCNGKTVRVAIQSGFKRAINTVLDAQITTIIAALVLYFLGTSSVRGFAMTLMIGIVTSLFTAVMVTQLYLSVWGETRVFSAKRFFGVTESDEPVVKFKHDFRFIKYRKIMYCVSIVIIVAGLAVGGIRGYNYGIDFTGGTMMQIDMGRSVTSSEMDKVLSKHNIAAELVFAGENNEQIVIRTIQSLDNEERDALFSDIKTEFGVADNSLLASDQFGPSVSKELRNNAVKGVIIASILMLIYIIFRFEWKFGVSAILGVLHDALLVIAFYAIFHITINNPFIAGILTVVGYSINDTIVIFDRIRENLGLMKKSKTEELIDKSINQTLIRSIMTSFTTVLVMIPLLIMTTSVIQEFVLPLMVGVIVGCISSITVSSPLYYTLTQMTGGPKYKGKRSKRTKELSNRESQEE